MRIFRTALLVATLAISGAACGDDDDDSDFPEVTESADTGDVGTDGTGDAGDGGAAGTSEEGTGGGNDTDPPGNKSPGPAPEGAIYDDEPSVEPPADDE